MNDKTKKPLPVFKSDADAEKFVDEADLSQYDLSGDNVRLGIKKKQEAQKAL